MTPTQQIKMFTGKDMKPDLIAANRLRRQALDIQARAYHSNQLAQQMLSLAALVKGE